jgi:HEAT repeat protein/Uri superfamily endonuclease
MQPESSIIGAYVLALSLEAPRTISIGRLGCFHLPVGWYLYSGSARGPGGLVARLKRHRRRLGPAKRAHWHIDYLREHATWSGAWVRPTSEGLECGWTRALLQLPGARIAVPGFGASDCQCPGHLVHVPELPDDAWFFTALGAEGIMFDNKALSELLEILATADDEQREAAALALARFGQEAVTPLAEMLAHGKVDTRWWAARALAEAGGEAAVLALVGVLGDPEPDVRACAALALGRLKAGEAAPALASLLADGSAFVASIAADALSMVGEPAIPSLAENLEAESSHTRLLAVRALGRIKSKQAIGPLFGVLEDPSYLVRYYAHEALEALGVGMVFFSP